MAWAPRSASVMEQPMHPLGQSYAYPTPPNQSYGQHPAPGYAPLPPTVNIPSNVPSGLDALLYMDQLIVKQKVEWVEVLLGCETKNKYKVLMPNGQELFDAVEENDCCTRNFCGPQRPFDLEIKDPQGKSIHIAVASISIGLSNNLFYKL